MNVVTAVFQTLANIALASSAAGCLTFAVIYWRSADWRGTALGRNVMAFMNVCGAVLTLAVITTFFPLPEVARQPVRFVIYTAIGAVIWDRVRILVRTQLYTASDDLTDDDRRTRKAYGVNGPEDRSRPE